MNDKTGRPTKEDFLQTIVNVQWGGHPFIICGAAGGLAKSVDGDEWFKIDDYNDHPCEGGVFLPPTKNTPRGTFVLFGHPATASFTLGLNSIIATSTDHGNTWKINKTTWGPSTRILGMVYGKGIACALVRRFSGTVGGVITGNTYTTISRNGINWSPLQPVSIGNPSTNESPGPVPYNRDNGAGGLGYGAGKFFVWGTTITGERYQELLLFNWITRVPTYFSKDGHWATGWNVSSSDGLNWGGRSNPWAAFPAETYGGPITLTNPNDPNDKVTLPNTIPEVSGQFIFTFPYSEKGEPPDALQLAAAGGNPGGGQSVSKSRDGNNWTLTGGLESSNSGIHITRGNVSYSKERKRYFVFTDQHTSDLGGGIMSGGPDAWVFASHDQANRSNYPPVYGKGNFVWGGRGSAKVWLSPDGRTVRPASKPPSGFASYNGIVY
jgi:hypothetical protein